MVQMKHMVKKKKGKIARSVLVMGLIGALTLSISACGESDGIVKENEDESYLGESIESHVVYPASIEGYVGDTMPFYDNGEYNIFYLADQRDGKQGYHPWALIKTKDFTEYDDKGVVIPYGDSGEDQDIALGTGSVVKDKDGLYHAFYTGHNDGRAPKEAVMHATSTNMEAWDKIPEDTFTGEENYSADDFRDPYVFYVEEESCYWMLVATRFDGDGVIARYTSTDLKDWKDEGVFFTEDMGSGTNLECPMIIQYEDNWYLSFSDQWPNRQVHYRVADSVNGEYKKPECDIFDGNGFYAGRLVSDGSNLYVVGWTATKKQHTDSQDYDWAGNMVTHKLKANEDGGLVPVVDENIKNSFSHELEMSAKEMTEGVKQDGASYEMGGENYDYVEFKQLSGSYMLEADVDISDVANQFGLAFNMDGDRVGRINILFDTNNNKIAFYNTTKVFEEDAQSEVDFDFQSVDSIHVTTFISDGIVCVYVNDKIALTTRMYMSQGMDWGIFGINSKAKWSNVKIYK